MPEALRLVHPQTGFQPLLGTHAVEHLHGETLALLEDLRGYITGQQAQEYAGLTAEGRLLLCWARSQLTLQLTSFAAWTLSRKLAAEGRPMPAGDDALHDAMGMGGLRDKLTLLPPLFRRLVDRADNLYGRLAATA